MAADDTFENKKFTVACAYGILCARGDKCTFAHSVDQFRDLDCPYGNQCHNIPYCTKKHPSDDPITNNKEYRWWNAIQYSCLNPIIFYPASAFIKKSTEVKPIETIPTKKEINTKPTYSQIVKTTTTIKTTTTTPNVSRAESPSKLEEGHKQNKLEAIIDEEMQPIGEWGEYESESQNGEQETVTLHLKRPSKIEIPTTPKETIEDTIPEMPSQQEIEETVQKFENKYLESNKVCFQITVEDADLIKISNALIKAGIKLTGINII